MNINLRDLYVKMKTWGALEGEGIFVFICKKHGLRNGVRS